LAAALLAYHEPRLDQKELGTFELMFLKRGMTTLALRAKSLEIES
jgi:hypothetical protein